MFSAHRANKFKDFFLKRLQVILVTFILDISSDLFPFDLDNIIIAYHIAAFSFYVLDQRLPVISRFQLPVCYFLQTFLPNLPSCVGLKGSERSDPPLRKPCTQAVPESISAFSYLATDTQDVPAFLIVSALVEDVPIPFDLICALNSSSSMRFPAFSIASTMEPDV